MIEILPTVWAVGSLSIVLCIGIICRLFKVFVPKDLAPLNSFVFLIGIPCLAFKAMATHNLLHLDWKFVLSFMGIRGLAAAIAALVTVLKKQSIGDFFIHYLSTTWMDAITFGIPVCTAMFGSAIGSHYPVLAAISSFVFELPLILVCLEIHKFNQQNTSQLLLSPQKQEEQQETTHLLSEEVEIQQQKHSNTGGSTWNSSQNKIPWKTISKKILIQILKLPPLDAIALGMIYGVTGLKLPTILDTTLTNLGYCVTPIATFCVGVFVCDFEPFKKAWKQTAIYTILKLFGLPILALSVVLGAKLHSPAAEIAIIISSLPLAFPAFTLSKQYNIGENIMSTCIASGTVFMLPTVLIISTILRSIHIFPSDSSQSQ